VRRSFCITGLYVTFFALAGFVIAAIFATPLQEERLFLVTVGTLFVGFVALSLILKSLPNEDAPSSRLPG
jgi:predicted tellurium resistance membrane protein TerC